MRTSTRRISTVFLMLTLAAVFQTGMAFADANQNSPELQTMQTMRVLAGALLSREVDEVSAEHRFDGPDAGWVLASMDSNLVRMPPKSERRSPAEVLDLLQPREDFIYLCDIPERDAWGSRLEVYYETEKLLSAEGAVTVRSSGANRRFDADVYEIGGFLPGAATDDLVIAAHRFVRWPIGVPESELRVESKVGPCPGSEDSSSETEPGPVPRVGTLGSR